MDGLGIKGINTESLFILGDLGLTSPWSAVNMYHRLLQSVVFI
jgi:hypothetical protein